MKRIIAWLQARSDRKLRIRLAEWFIDKSSHYDTMSVAMSVYFAYHTIKTGDLHPCIKSELTSDKGGWESVTKALLDPDGQFHKLQETQQATSPTLQHSEDHAESPRTAEAVLVQAGQQGNQDD